MSPIDVSLSGRVLLIPRRNRFLESVIMLRSAAFGREACCVKSVLKDARLATIIAVDKR